MADADQNNTISSYSGWHEAQAILLYLSSISPTALALHQSVMMHVDQTQQERGGENKSDISVWTQKQTETQIEDMHSHAQKAVTQLNVLRYAAE